MYIFYVYNFELHDRGCELTTLQLQKQEHVVVSIYRFIYHNIMYIRHIYKLELYDRGCELTTLWLQKQEHRVVGRNMLCI